MSQLLANPTLLAFYILGAMTVLAAYRVVTAELITHAALWMALSFASVAGIFLVLGAEFLAAVQVLIYAGAITTMVIFAIMLSDVEDIKEIPGGDSIWRRIGRQLLSPLFGPLPLVVGGGFAAILIAVYGRTWGVLVTQPVPGGQLANTTRMIGTELFTRFVIPFEVASIVLLVAMVGAIILTRREGSEE